MPEEIAEAIENDAEATEEVEPEASEEEVESTEEEEEVVEETEQKTYKLKINGEESDFTEEQVLQMASKSKGADAKFTEASEMRNESLARLDQVNSVIQTLKSNPADVLSKLGINVQEFAEEYLLPIYEKQRDLSEMSVEQKQLYEAQQQIEALKKQSEDSQKAADEVKFAQAAEAARIKYDNEITECLTESYLPKNPGIVSRIAGYLIQGKKQGLDISTKDAVQLEKDIQNEFGDISKKTDAQKLVSILGEETIAKIKGVPLSLVPSPRNGNKVGKVASKKGKQLVDFATLKEQLDAELGPINYGEVDDD